MFATDDSIVAIATPPGRGGIGIVRISGPSLPGNRCADSRSCAAARAALRDIHARSQPRPMKWSRPTSPRRTPTPASTSSKSAPTAVRSSSSAIVASAIAAGARLAEPGEFTLRAFLNGKRDLIQAEAVADLIDAATPLQARVAFDQLEGTLTRAHRRDRRRAVRSHRAARGVAGFSRRGIPLHRTVRTCHDGFAASRCASMTCSPAHAPVA